MSYLLQQLLERSAKQYPAKEAVIYKTHSITYQELDVVSNQLAHVLRSTGIERGDRVGIYLNKSIEAVAAIFGILKAGAAYVPLDPSAPVKRVAFIIDNCGLKALVGSQAKITTLKGLELSSVQCVVLTDGESKHDSDFLKRKVVSWAQVLQAPATSPLDPTLIEDDLAYILYTSGSTGTPKGVMISHRASLTFVNWAYDCFQVQPTDRLSNHAPFHFDLSIFDIFTAIKAGATVLLVPPALSVFPMNLANFIEEQQITIWYSVPSALTRLLLYGALSRHQFSHLRIVLFAGEVFPIKYLRQLMEQIAHPKYYNLYGPTETNVCTYLAVPEISPDRVDPLSIGKACANSEVLVVNEQHEIVGPGEVGELYVRGPSLMTGYWGMPEKSQQVLVPYVVHPAFGPEIVYRTGDLVKEAPDGNYLFLGRRDNMIKSRGYRIELGEIETALYSHPAVLEAAVIPIPDEQIGNQIKAVVVAQDGMALSKSALLSFCAERLPKYMIPGIIEFHHSLPKTSTGKVDKTRLR